MYRYARRSGYGYKRSGYGRTVYKTPFGGGTTYTALSYKRKRPSGGFTTTQTGAPLRAGARVRRKQAYSYTQTKTRRRNQVGKATKVSENMSISATTFGRRASLPRGLLRAALGNNTRNTNTSGTWTSGTGQQRVFYFLNGQLSDLQAIKELAQGEVTANDAKLILKNMKMRLDIKNQSNCAGKLTIYDLGVRFTPGNNTVDNPVEAWRKGYADMGQTDADLLVGNSPLNSAEFRRYFYVKKVTYIPLEPGQQHQHTVWSRFNRVFSSTRWDNANVTTLPGLTVCTMIVWHGSLGHESAAPGTVTYMPMKIDYAAFLSQSFAGISSNAPSFVGTDNLPKTIADFDHMGEAGDQDVDLTAA